VVLGTDAEHPDPNPWDDRAVRLSALSVAVVVTAFLVSGASAASGSVYRAARVIDGDTIELGNGRHVRLVQIDTPEVFFGTECYGPQASTTTERLLPVGTRVRLVSEPATDRIDQYGRLLRYVVRASDGVDVNIRLVAVGAAAPYFYSGRRGRYANQLEALAKRAKARRLGLWRVCPRTQYDPYRGIETRR
jgi:endonuclease YncB( thermonuclease family)